jgi:hypothetical protein
MPCEGFKNILFGFDALNYKKISRLYFIDSSVIRGVTNTQKSRKMGVGHILKRDSLIRMGNHFGVPNKYI